MLVYVVASYPTVRTGLVTLVGALPGWQVAGQSAPDSLAVPAAGAGSGANRGIALPQPPDVVLADLDDETDAAAVAGWLDALRPLAGLVALTVEPQGRRDGRSGSTAVLAELAQVAGERGLAFGALRRDATPEEIGAALGAVAGGLITLDRRIASLLLQPSAAVAAPPPERLGGPEEPLTARELEVLQLLAQGLPNKIIAARLHITEHTAKFHVSSILMKLGAASRTEAVTTAARRGLLML